MYYPAILVILCIPFLPHYPYHVIVFLCIVFYGDEQNQYKRVIVASVITIQLQCVSSRSYTEIANPIGS